VRDQLLILVHEDSAGTIHGITPLVKTTLGGDWMGMTKVRNAGSVPGTNLTEMAPYLWSSGRELQVAQALAQALEQYRRTCDWIELRGVPFDTSFGRAFARTPVAEQADWHAPTPYFLLHLPADWESLRSRLTKNGREYVRQVGKRLERLVDQGHQVDVQIEDRPERIPDALEDFFRLHRVRSTIVQDPADAAFHPDWFRAEPTRQFMRAVAGDLSERGQLIIARLLIDREVVASRLILPAHDHLYFFHSGFDPAWSKHSVMALLTSRVIQAAIRTPGVETVNLSTQADRAKRLWSPEDGHWLGNLRIASPTLRGRCIDYLLRPLGAQRAGQADPARVLGAYARRVTRILAPAAVSVKA
jgi:CelD/BcsL family acetyltransferase involved in cellulose biosynthesis